MGSQIGAEKIAARRLGISHAEWLAKRTAGLKWCTFGKHWQIVGLFACDATRGDGLAHVCFECFRLYKKDRNKYSPFPPSNPIRRKAGRAVNRAIESGKLARAADVPCARCNHIGHDRRHEYHHHRGYEKEFWLDVICLCLRCHRKEGWRERKKKMKTTCPNFPQRTR